MRKKGVQGVLCKVTSSKWFNAQTFEIWFPKLFLPAVAEKLSPKLIIGDNFLSHFSSQVVTEAAYHNIRFVTLPSKTMHICQPSTLLYFIQLRLLRKIF